MGQVVHGDGVRQGHCAENQAVFRRVNNRIDAFQDRHAQRMSLLCECADGACMAPIDIEPARYRDVRAHPRRFVVAPEHVYPELEFLVEAAPGWWIVEKFEDRMPTVPG